MQMEADLVFPLSKVFCYQLHGYLHSAMQQNTLHKELRRQRKSAGQCNANENQCMPAKDYALVSF